MVDIRAELVKILASPVAICACQAFVRREEGVLERIVGVSQIVEMSQRNESKRSARQKRGSILEFLRDVLAVNCCCRFHNHFPLTRLRSAREYPNPHSLAALCI